VIKAYKVLKVRADQLVSRYVDPPWRKVYKDGDEIKVVEDGFCFLNYNDASISLTRDRTTLKDEIWEVQCKSCKPIYQYVNLNDFNRPYDTFDKIAFAKDVLRKLLRRERYIPGEHKTSMWVKSNVKGGSVMAKDINYTSAVYCKEIRLIKKVD
jgi:hypothetical protein